MRDTILWAIVAVLFLFSIFLAVAETSFVRMSRVKAMALAESGSSRARRLLVMLERPEQTLNVVLLVVLVSQLGTATLVGVLLEGVGGWVAIVVGIVVQIILFFVIGEVMPKTFAVQHTDRAVLLATPMLWFFTRFPPLRWVSSALIGVANILLPGRGLKEGPFVTEAEIRTMADVAADEAAIELEERRLIHSIFEFGDALVREVMRPRVDVVTVASTLTVDEAIAVGIDGGFSRLPVFGASADDIVGIAYLKDLVRVARAGGGDRAVQSIMQPPVFVPEQKRAAELLREMQTKRVHMAIVIDEHGTNVGIVTLEDLLEEIVGEIVDEYDRAEPTVHRLPDGAFVVPGGTPIDELSEALGIELPDTEWDTVSGLVFNIAGHVPVAGETVRYEDIELRTERVEGNRILSVTVRSVAPDAATPDPEPAAVSDDP